MAVAQFTALVDHARSDPNVVGLILAGSRGKGAYVTPESDFDAYIVLADGALVSAYAERFVSAHGDPVEYLLCSLESFRAHALPGTPTRWNAYTFAHIRPLVDKLGGEIGRIAAAKARPGPGDARESLDGYVNLYYRSKKNFAAGRMLEGRLDAAESIPWLLDFVFAAHDRVRPFNKWLLWELENHPLGDPWPDLPTRLEAVLGSGDVVIQRSLFLDAEALARASGLDDVIASWGPDVAFLRA